MTEHHIRFRGAWELLELGPGRSAPRPVTLPIAWPPEFAGPIRLTRRFGRPPIDPALESIRLELKAVPGLRSVTLNGAELGPIGGVDRDIPLPSALPARNTLTLEVVPGPPGPDGGWGAIALVIGPRRADGAAPGG